MLRSWDEWENSSEESVLSHVDAQAAQPPQNLQLDMQGGLN
jgi:hypothetical protein